MSGEFTMRRVSSFLIKCFEDFGFSTFDCFWAASLIDDIQDKHEIEQVLIEAELAKVRQILSDSFFPILREAKYLEESDNDVLSSNTSYIEGIDFLLTGRRQFFPRGFLIEGINITEMHQRLTLVNALVGIQTAKTDFGMAATYLKVCEVKKILDPLKAVLQDKFDIRWEILQDFWNLNFRATNEKFSFTIQSRNQSSFKQFFFDPCEPRFFIQSELVPFLSQTAQLESGILITRSY